MNYVKVNNFYLSNTDSHFISLGHNIAEYQSLVRQASYKYVTDWTLALDVGAHVGIFSADFSKRFQKVYAFEPMPFNLNCLEKNIKDNISIFPFGLGDKESTLEMRYNITNSGGSEILLPNTNGRVTKDFIDKIFVEVKTLDSINIELKIGLIKIDVQGMEEQVLLGAKNTILKNQPVVILEEKVPKTNPADRTAIEKAKNIILSYGYTLKQMVNNDAIYTAS